MVEEALFLMGVLDGNRGAVVKKSLGGEGVLGGSVATDWPRRLPGSGGLSDASDIGKQESDVDTTMVRGRHYLYLMQIRTPNGGD